MLVPLEPGARGVLSVAPSDVLEHDTEWTCARCGEPFISKDVWRVDYRHPDGGASSYLACRNCAEQLEPVRVTIDVRTLRRVASGDEDDLAAVAQLAERILSERSGPDTGVVSLRWADLFGVAEAHGRSPNQIADELEEAGALISRGQGFRRDFEMPAAHPEQTPPPA